MILVGTTLAAYVMDQVDTWEPWMRNAEALQASHPEGVEYFAAIEIDGRGLEPFGPFIERLVAVGGKYWVYLLDDGRTSVTTANRLSHLSMGQNLVSHYATAAGATHLLFMAADTMPPDDVIPRMLELGHPMCAPYLTTYQLRGPQVHKSASGIDYDAHGFKVMQAIPSAACVFIDRELFKRIRWRIDPDLNMTDDPSYAYDSEHLFGVPPHVRYDVLARHFPEAVGAIETRGHDMKVVR